LKNKDSKRGNRDTIKVDLIKAEDENPDENQINEEGVFVGDFLLFLHELFQCNRIEPNAFEVIQKYEKHHHYRQQCKNTLEIADSSR